MRSDYGVLGGPVSNGKRPRLIKYVLQYATVSRHGHGLDAANFLNASVSAGKSQGMQAARLNMARSNSRFSAATRSAHG